ncbi:hypothetical protein L596_027216 [Steinernema carpocapsae]|uniref:Uncharacterized protein n=1 Tax=Steinernema carpocapsae TaxID=34508 RepID=A0A4U5M3N3_STECR|nr:hypothetical protein L596_027216 [Steinernema carpocapsae]
MLVACTCRRITTDNAYHRVFFHVLAYHAAVFAVCEIARRFVERTFNPQFLRYFFRVELHGTRTSSWRSSSCSYPSP